MLKKPRPALSLLLAAVVATACSDSTAPERLPDGCTSLVRLDQPIGSFVRLKASTDATYPCLRYEAGRSAGNEYLLLFENMVPGGAFGSSLFPGIAGDSVFAYSIATEPYGASANVVTRQMAQSPTYTLAGAAGDDEYAWDFGAGRLREFQPQVPPHLAVSGLLRADGMAGLGSGYPRNEPAIGDTIEVLIEGVPRLGIATGFQHAIIRYVDANLIIAEDVRLTTVLTRPEGGFNTPITEMDLLAIATEYDVVARVQGDLFFENRHNIAVESVPPNRVIAVHSLMPSADYWGYTYGATNYFVFDYWVASDGVTKTINQHPQRLADNLFMHEITHMRHSGLLQRNNRHWVDAERGHRWLIEGFARFSERLPVAARLLGTTTPSRTGNIVLPRNPAFNNAYFLDDVPTYLWASSSGFFGYQMSAFVFDYFADQVAQAGGNWMVATREFLLAANTRASLDAVVSRWIPGTTFADLFTRARIALYMDDIGTPGVPPWTQYHQFRLRESRPAPSNLVAQDPRNQWLPFSPGTDGPITGNVAAGAAAGHILTGSDGDPSVIIRITGPAGAHAILSVTRIR